MSVTGDRIRKRRKQLDINADALAEYLGVSRTTVFRYENGGIEKVPANLIPGIAKFLRTSERFLMGWEDSPETESSETSPLILDYYNQLNDAGKGVATDRVKELTEIPRYTKEEVPDHLRPRAAHNDDQSENQLAKMREDMTKLKRPE